MPDHPQWSALMHVRKRIRGMLACRDTREPVAHELWRVPEQKSIVAKVDSLMALCDELEAGLRESSTVSEKLASAVVASTGSAP